MGWGGGRMGKPISLSVLHGDFVNERDNAYHRLVLWLPDVQTTRANHFLEISDVEGQPVDVLHLASPCGYLQAKTLKESASMEEIEYEIPVFLSSNTQIIWLATHFAQGQSLLFLGSWATKFGRVWLLVVLLLLLLFFCIFKSLSFL